MNKDKGLIPNSLLYTFKITSWNYLILTQLFNKQIVHDPLATEAKNWHLPQKINSAFVLKEIEGNIAFVQNTQKKHEETIEDIKQIF